jgi:hypothetical protein
MRDSTQLSVYLRSLFLGARFPNVAVESSFLQKCRSPGLDIGGASKFSGQANPSYFRATKIPPFEQQAPVRFLIVRVIERLCEPAFAEFHPETSAS